MPDNNKPLFSRPVLAVIMLLCTLAIWALHSTAPNAKLPSPDLKTWHTQSGIPVIWLNQTEWQQGDKLEIRLTFHSSTKDTALTEAMLAMLMSNSLPLSTTTINQRLAPLAAKVSSHYDHENQTIGLTLSNQLPYLTPSLSLIANWLSQPDFKSRTFQAWQRQQNQVNLDQYDIERRLFSPLTGEHNEYTPESVSLEQVARFYQDLHVNAGTIFVIGNLSVEAKKEVESALNQISRPYTLLKSNAKLDQAIHASSIIRATEHTHLWQTKSAMALSPITSVQEWMSLQIWGADLVSTLNQQDHIDFVQLGMSLSQQQPWIFWNIQYASLFINPSQEGALNTIMQAASFTEMDKIPSIKDSKNFETLLNSFKKQLEQQVQSPTWWGYIATQVTHENSQLTLNSFIKNYKEAVDSFTIDDYKTALKHLLKTSSYQEIQVYQ